jgi:oligopeptide/dipeptide ABC transporter ATP-binding protein
VPAGTTLALVGESGSGKSTMALAISRLLPPGAVIASGSVQVGSTDMAALTGSELRAARGPVAAYLAQDALAALNPVVRVGRQIAEVYRRRQHMSWAEAERNAARALQEVHIDRPDRVARMYPHQLSGGMRQRVMIAIALAFQPEVLVADEPTTALDVTVQADILRLVTELQWRNGLTVIWITHDMSVVAEIADSVAVVYGGRLVEQADVCELFDHPTHPYTRALLKCFGNADALVPKQPFETIPGSPPTGKLPGGCPFHPRCPQSTAECERDLPEIGLVGVRHGVACHHEAVMS